MTSTSSIYFKKAFLVEDEERLAEILKLSLEKEGVQVEAVTTFALADAYIHSRPLNEIPDLILLDRNLPDGDGLTLCPLLRTLGYEGSILVLTASGTVEQRVEGLDAGADDYLPKPFSWEELVARIRALSRRKEGGFLNATAKSLWRCNDDRLEIQGPKGWVKLTPIEYKLAKKFITSSGALFKKEELLKEVWGFQWLPQTRTVDFFLGRLRKSFEMDSQKPKHFLTVRGAGYRFDP